MRAAAACALHYQQHAFCRSAAVGSRTFATAAGGVPNKLPPELEKMLKAAGITLPPGARVEVKDMRGADFDDLPPFIREMASKRPSPSETRKAETSKSNADRVAEKTGADKLPDVIALPPAADSSSEPTPLADKSPSAGRRLRGRQKHAREDAGRGKTPQQSIFDLFAGNGVKSFVMNAPEGAKAEAEDVNIDASLQARDWYQMQLPGSSAQNPIDVNYFDRAVYSDFHFAVVPSLVGAPPFSLEFPWRAGSALPEEARLIRDDAGKLARILIPCKDDVPPFDKVSAGNEKCVHVELCKGHLPADARDVDTTISFVPATGNFFSPAGGIVKKTLIGNGEMECNVCSSTIKASSEAFVAETDESSEEEPFLVCSECIASAGTMRDKAYAALSGSQVDRRPAKGTSNHVLQRFQSGRLLGAPTKKSQVDGAEDDEGMPNLLTGMSPSRTFRVEKDVEARFADILGQEIAVEKLREFVDILRFPDSYDLIGSKVPKGGLLIGPPGTGKTLLAQAVAGECQLPFISVQGSEFNESLVGSGPRNVRKLFKTARKQAALHGGCIVFIDEIDSIGRSRSRSDNSSASQGYCDTLNQLLAEIDGFHSKTDQIVLLAATNRANVLDKALLRAGRFDRVIPMERPNIKEREELFWHYLKRLAWRDGSTISEGDAELLSAMLDSDISSGSLETRVGQLRKLSFCTSRSNTELTAQLHQLTGAFVSPRMDILLARTSDVTQTLTLKMQSRSILKIGSKFYVANDEDVAKVSDETVQAIGAVAKGAARMTTGFTGATISSICNEAGIMAVRERIRQSSMQNRLIVTSVASNHIAKAIDFVTAGSEKKNFRMLPDEKSAVAYHEAGHSVVAFLLDDHPDPVKVTIVPRDSGSLGFMMPGEPLSEVRQSKNQLEAQICVLMGGRISEQIFCHDVAAGAKSDIEQATDLARHYVGTYGMSAGNVFVNTNDERWLSEVAKAKRDESIFTLIDQCYEKTTKLLLEHKEKVESLRAALLEKETLFADEIKDILA